MAWLALVAAASPARADAVEPPTLLELAEAPRPEGAEVAAELRVRLRITVGADGSVTEAEVLDSAGEAFDAAAREALLRSRFAPARRDGVTIPVRIGFEYVFPAVVREAPAPDDGQPSRAAAPSAPADAGTPAEPAPARELPAETPAEPRPDEPTEQTDVGAPIAAETEEITVDGPIAEARALVRSEAEERRHSAEAVDVVDLAEARTRTADLGEVLARTEGVNVRRSGGLGSNERLSIAGLEGRQIRYFFDGIPLRYVGFGLGLANIPVGLVERVEIYRGVVPVRYGADAVGGAIDLVSELETAGHRATVSYQAGSFETHRLGVGGRYRDGRTGLFARGDAYFDYAENDYDIRARVADTTGRIEERSVELRNAAYRSYGLALEAGVAGRPGARRATLRAFLTDHEKGVPHNLAMSVPYGEVHYGQADRGIVARYENDFLDERLDLTFTAGFVAHRVRFVDEAECRYDWFDRCTFVRPVPGEMTVGGRNLGTIERSVYLRSNLVVRPRAGHAIVLSLSPEIDVRETERETVGSSTLTGRGLRRMIVAGAEYELTLSERLQNSAFAKVYSQRITADDHVLGNVITRDARSTTSGVGDSLRLDVTDDVYLKVSYEWSTRMPGADEYFGDGALTLHNYELRPERSHNANVSLHGRLERDRLGVIRGELALFARRLHDLIWRTAEADTYEHENVGEARALGVTGSASYRSPGDFVDLRASASYLDFRNITSVGAYQDVRGDRVPNLPFLEASGEIGAGADELVREGDRLSALFGFRYVHEFYLGYESRGLSDGKLTIPSQFVMHAALRYAIRASMRTFNAVIEAQNLADVAVYDFYGIQRPRRAVYAKLSLDF